MNKLYVLLFICFISLKVNSQWVTIPDANFAYWLTWWYPQCMNGNLMDTTCTDITNEYTLNMIQKNIDDLDGVQYFDNLHSLDCSNNNLTTLPPLPSTLESLNCHNNQIVSLPILPSSLEHLICYKNQLISLPALPNYLTFLYCSENQLTSLSTLPNSITSIICYDNQLTSLPALPTSLEVLKCYNNQLSNLPILPNALKIIYCQNNALTSLPSLPFSIDDLNCDNNILTALPNLPVGLNYLSCKKNYLTSLPSLPNTLYNLNCSNNFLNTLPALPNFLENLSFASNMIDSISALPNSLLFLQCDSNPIIHWPSLPSNLVGLYCSYSSITSLPPLPSTLKILFSYNNPFLSSIPDLPDTMNTILLMGDSSLKCLPELNVIGSLHFSGCPIQCVPNYGNVSTSYPPLSSLPLCDIFNNPNNCEVYWNISGKVYNDDNSNCIIDAGEQSLSNLKLQLFQSGNLIQQVYSGNEGLYSFDTGTGTYTYTVDTTDLPVLVSCPSSGFHTSILTPADSMDYNMDFAMQCKPGFDVGVKNIVRQSGQFFPANYATIKIGAGDMANFYGLTCAIGVNGSVIIDFTGPITYISEAPGALIPSVVGNTLTYSISDFGLVNFNSDFRIILQTDTNAQAGDQVCFTVNVTPTSGDNDVSNNSLQHCFTVVNSFDPNAKEVYPEGGLTPNQEWMTYTIHFQNTGNAPAQNIYIIDTLDNNLIPSSFTLLSYSHEPLTQLFGNVVKFNFPNINLPDSTNDEPNSHGFVQYKVKMVQGLPVGTIISNTAYNYFDFNSPVTTNTVSNMVGVTSIADNSEKINISVFPNPATDEINISFNLNIFSEIKIELYNSLGQVVKTISNNKYESGKNLINFSVSDLVKGIYHFKFSAGNEIVMKRVVKM